MIIGLDSIGDTIVDSRYPMSLSNKFYSIEMQNAKFDELYISQSGDIKDTSVDDWVVSTYFHAKFQNDLEAGNVSLGGLEINRWKIRRRRIDGLKFKELGTIDPGTDENFYYLDVLPLSDITYEYEVIPMSGDIEGQAYTTQIKAYFDNWWLVDVDTKETYPFYANLEVGDINNNTKRFVYEGFDRFPTISYGNQRYHSGTITAILLDAFTNTNKNYRERVEAFIDNHKSKYMKNADGDMWIVDTYTTRRTPMLNKIYDDGQTQQNNISTITFDWQEVGVYEDE